MTESRARRAPLHALLTLLLIASLLPFSTAAAPAAASDTGRIPDRILVKWEKGTPDHAKAAARSAVGAKKIGAIDPLGVDVLAVPAKASPRALAALQRTPRVAYAELDAAVEAETVAPNDPEWYRQWGPVKVNAPQAWAVTTGVRDTVIAVLDTGVAPVADLKGKLLPGRNVMTGTSDTTDSNGHGTMSAGVASASTNNGIGVAGYCWDCAILPVKVMESSGTMSDLARGIVWATDNGADVISMSLSGASGTTTVLDAVRYARDRNVSLVAAAGNQGDSIVRYPAAYPEVIAVAGTMSSDELYSWSNFGSWVDVAAPGQNRTLNKDGAVFLYGGTSSATPAVAGVLGLLRSAGASAAAARTALQDGSAPLSAVRYGRIDAKAALDLLGASTAPKAPAPDPEPDPAPEPAPAPTPEPSPAPAPAPDPEPEPTISLLVSTSKQKGLNTASVRWSAANGSRVELRIDGRATSVPNSGSYQHATGQRGSTTITYQVCDLSSCSKLVTASW
ncbi:S8 family serine peptidase [Egicoccus sp. AB-alg6-2]|uniref:S8 family serine peptidase n=1 Tax=Egicoccus sp. AB-alg6-2 TaxID=3242692 RepID=UPI00359ECDF2